MATTDDIAREVARRVNDRNFQRLREIKGYIEDIVTELTMVLRKGAVLYTATVTTDASTNMGTLPDNVFTVLRVQTNSGAKYEVVDNETFRDRENESTSLLTAYVKEDVPNWTIKIIESSGSAVTLSIDYLVTSRNPNILPEYYENIITAGAEALYHLRRSPREKYLTFLQEYNRLKSMYLENQQYNDPVIDQQKSLDQLDAEAANNQNIINNNYLSVRGLY